MDRIALAYLAPIACLGTLAAAQSPGSFVTDGCGCPDSTTNTGPVLYGILAEGQWGLDESSLTFSSGGGSWSLAPGGSYLERSSQAAIVPASDNSVSGPFDLPFAFQYPGGQGFTTAIDINSNGRVYLEAGTNPFSLGTSASQVLPDFLSATPSVCVLGVNLNVNAGGLIYFETRVVSGSQVAFVTWESVPEFPSAGENTLQCQLWSNGEIVLSYRGTNGAESLRDALVGVSAGGGASDPGPSSLVVPPTLSFVDGVAAIGNNVQIGVRGVPLSTTSGFLGIGIPAPSPTIPSLGFGVAPGCTMMLAPGFARRRLILDPPLAQVSLPWTYDPALVGVPMQCQAFLFDPSQASPLPVVSNRGTLTLAEPHDLLFVAEGPNSFYGSPSRPGFFRLESSQGATHPDITGLEVRLLGVEHDFHTEGNAGLDGQGFFTDGNGQGPTCQNAYYGSDLTTGLVYGGPQQGQGCGGSGTTGWVGSSPVAGSSTRYRQLDFEFGSFSAGETFRFDCDTDGDAFHAGSLPLSITVSFADGSSITQTTQAVSVNRSEGVLIR